MSSGAPKQQVSGYFRDLRAGCLGWILFSALIVIIYLGVQRYTGFDTWMWREPLARWATFDTWVSWADVVGPQEIQMAGRSHATLRLDTDGDGCKEWVVKYQYDMANPVDRSPVSVAIYDSDRGNPPVIYPYRLVLPQRDYAGETNWYGTAISVGDFIKGDTTGRPEILVRGYGIPGEVSLFRYEPSRKVDEWMDPRNYPAVYRCIGTFRGDSVDGPDANNEVVVVTRFYDRSQLAIKSRYTYNATRDSYLATDEKTLLTPVETWVDFTFNEPWNVEKSEYPEKVVLAYYQRFPNEDYLPLMSTLARERAKLAAQTQNVSAYGLPVMPANIDRILVQNVSYTPQAENIPYVDIQGTTHFGAVVHVEFLYTAKNDLTKAKKTHSVNWFVIKEKGEWKLDHVEP